jgi:lipoprotein NlpI
MTKILYIFILLALISSGAFLTYEYFYSETLIPGESLLEGDVSLSTTTGQLIDLGNGIVAEILENQTSTSTLAKLNMATLERGIVEKEGGVRELFEANKKKIEEIVSSLKQNPDNFDKWIELGLYRKMTEDYVGAEESWKNASVLRPKNALPLSNLGNLYGYYLKDSEIAEGYYLASIKAEPESGFWYYQTFLFYKEVLGDSIKAKNIISEGVKNNPYDEDLKNILNSL